MFPLPLIFKKELGEYKFSHEIKECQALNWVGGNRTKCLKKTQQLIREHKLNPWIPFCEDCKNRWENKK
jgi:hypothetical protein